jgi:hypothetical protein
MGKMEEHEIKLRWKVEEEDQKNEEYKTLLILPGDI